MQQACSKGAGALKYFYGFTDLDKASGCSSDRSYILQAWSGLISFGRSILVRCDWIKRYRLTLVGVVGDVLGALSHPCCSVLVHKCLASVAYPLVLHSTCEPEEGVVIWKAIKGILSVFELAPREPWVRVKTQFPDNQESTQCLLWIHVLTKTLG